EGYIFKIFDLDLIESYFKLLKKSNPFYKEFRMITLLVMENIAYLDLRKKNLVIEDLRRKYARSKDKFYAYKKATENVAEQIDKAYYGKILKKPITENSLVRELYIELFAIKTTNTQEFLNDIDEIFNKYFVFER